MGKAYTEEERKEVHDRLRRAGLKLLAANGIKGISIRDITNAAGIAQGGFYNFYQDKRAFVIDLMALRVKEKTEIMLKNKKKTAKDPRGFIVELLYKEGMHLKENKAFDNTQSESVSFWLGTEQSAKSRISEVYLNMLKELVSYWEEIGYKIECDYDGILELGKACSVLFSNAALIDPAYFGDIYRVFCESGVDRYFRAKRKKKGSH